MRLTCLTEKEFESSGVHRDDDDKDVDVNKEYNNNS